MTLAEWSALRVAFTSLAWLVAMPVVVVLGILGAFWLRGRRFQRATRGQLGTQRLDVLWEYGPRQKALFLLFWLGPPLMLFIAWWVAPSSDPPPRLP